MTVVYLRKHSHGILSLVTAIGLFTKRMTQWPYSVLKPHSAGPETHIALTIIHDKGNIMRHAGVYSLQPRGMKCATRIGPMSVLMHKIQFPDSPWSHWDALFFFLFHNDILSFFYLTVQSSWHCLLTALNFVVTSVGGWGTKTSHKDTFYFLFYCCR